MFVHIVLFEIRPEEIDLYRADSWMWASYASKFTGFVSYHTSKRHGTEDQYASVYNWKRKEDHEQFMNLYHEELVLRSKADVKVLGYYNLDSIDEMVPEHLF